MNDQSSQVAISLKADHPPRESKAVLDYRLSGGKIQFVNMGELRTMKFATKRYLHVEFVVDLEGKLILGYEHYFLSGGASHVLAAGGMTLEENGSVALVSNVSGHYKPTEKESLNMERIMAKTGLDLSSAKFYKYLEPRG